MICMFQNTYFCNDIFKEVLKMTFHFPVQGLTEKQKFNWKKLNEENQIKRDIL